MYTPTQPSQPYLALSAVGSAAGDLSLTAPPFDGPGDTTLRVHSAVLDVLAGQAATVRGTLTSADLAGGDHRATPTGLADRTVRLQIAFDGGWRTVARAHTNPGGRFELRYRPRRTGSERVRISFEGDTLDDAAQRRLGRLNVFRMVEASWYGGGGGLACGGVLTNATMGVASRTLPCGTRVTLRYDGRSIRVPVVDRGPFVGGREFDLTEAAKEALGFEGVGELWSTS